LGELGKVKKKTGHDLAIPKNGGGKNKSMPFKKDDDASRRGRTGPEDSLRAKKGCSTFGHVQISRKRQTERSGSKIPPR